jgi:hypothetical protein
MAWLNPVRVAMMGTDSMAMGAPTLAGLSRSSFAKLSPLRPAPDALQNAILKHAVMDLLTVLKTVTMVTILPVMVAHHIARSKFVGTDIGM